MRKYQITGMSCAACSSRIEKAAFEVAGVTSCSVSLLTNSMAVEGSASDGDMVAAVKGAGYGAEAKDRKTNHGPAASDSEELLKDRETPALKNV